MQRALRRCTLLVAAVAFGCGGERGSAVCGFATVAGATMVLEQLRAGTKVLRSVPPDLQGTVRARAAGYAVGEALSGQSSEGVVLSFEGEGFPTRPGFGLILVEDSTDSFKGVLIYDLSPPRDYPQLGVITDGGVTLPVYGLRVAWGLVSDRRCPLFGPADSAESPEP